MKRLLALVPVILLVGCATSVPVKIKFPDVPEDMLIECPALETVDTPTTSLSDVVGIVANNYIQYHECQVKVDDWITWYKAQKDIFK